MKQCYQIAWEDDLDTGYREMAQDEAREIEALDLAEATIARRLNGLRSPPNRGVKINRYAW